MPHHFRRNSAPHISRLQKSRRERRIVPRVSSVDILSNLDPARSACLRRRAGGDREISTELVGAPPQVRTWLWLPAFALIAYALYLGETENLTVVACVWQFPLITIGMAALLVCAISPQLPFRRVGI